MSELIDIRDNRPALRRQFLATASALVLMGYVAAHSDAAAEDTDKPTVWIELGGQMEMMQGTSSPFTAPFMFVSPTPAPIRRTLSSMRRRLRIIRLALMERSHSSRKDRIGFSRRASAMADQRTGGMFIIKRPPSPSS